jgi:two-component system sensor histidine kinase HydH
MNVLKRRHLASVSPWVLAAACGLLTVIIGVFALNNYRRDKALMTDILLEKGVTLIRFVSSSARSSILASLRSGRDDVSTSWPVNVQSILEHASGHPGIQLLALIDSEGEILANSVHEARFSQVSPETMAFLDSSKDDTPGSQPFNYRIRNDGNGTVFQVAASFDPFARRIPGPVGLLLMPPGMANQERLDREGMWKGGRGRKGRPRFALPKGRAYKILVEINMQQFNKRLQRQKLEIIILSIVLLLVGVGGWLSILTLEGLKGSQSRLRRVEAFRDILISSLPVGLIATDNSDQIILCNRFAQELTGISEKVAIGKNTSVFKGMDGIQEAFEDSGKHEGMHFSKEVQFKDDLGVRHTVLLNRIAIIDRGGSFVGSLLMMQDLSLVKQLEKDLRRSERLAALGKMAAGVAHELRNPLSSIKGLALVLQSKFDSENKDRETAGILVQEVERLNRSISELLDYARPQTLKKTEVNLHDILNKAVSLLSMDAEACGVSIELHCEKEMDPIMADGDKLNQVFLNLFLNAIQAMAEGGTLSVSTEKTESGIQISVSDTGCGISSKDLARVFDPYFTTKPEGTGLGMAMSAKIVEEHGGSITLVSTVGQGTSVAVKLPC